MGLITVGTTSDGLHLLRGRDLPGCRLVDVTESPETVEVLWHRHSLSPAESDRLYPLMPRLFHVHVDTAGTDHVEHLLRPGISVSTAHAAQTRGVAEWVVAAVLWDAKRLGFYQRNSDRAVWAHPDGVRTVRGRVLASYGAGAILRQALPALNALGVRVRATSRRLQPVDGAEVLPWAEWLGRLPGASWLLLDAPLTDETRHRISRPVLAHLDSACLINLARGELIEPGAVGWARRQGHLRSAVLDVHRQEPLPRDHPAWADDQVLVTPHDAWRGDGILQARVDEFIAVLAGLLGR